MDDSDPTRAAGNGSSGMFFRPGETSGPIPEKIGPYLIRERLGGGGMGDVYRGERITEHVHTHVAIKLVRPELDSDAMQRRFQREAEVLNDLGDHPNVARLREVDRTEDGRPYLVLDYVEGQTLDRYCEVRNLTVRERLELFLKICDAIQHAHEMCIAHRDLKPSNVLVTPQGVPKVIDFGIAKVLRAGASKLTVSASAPMTLEYASPEQVRGDPVGMPSDVYSLGVILYELLTGCLPYRIDESADRTTALRRAICDQEPARPSEIVSKKVIADSRHRPASVGKGSGSDRATRTTALARQLRGELDFIILQALRKEPQRRYRSVSEMSEDIRRHLRGEPVQARPPSAFYLTRKFIQRHVAAVIVVVAVIGGITGVVFGAVRGQVRRLEGEAIVLRRGQVENLTTELTKLYGSIEGRVGAVELQEMIAHAVVDYLEAVREQVPADAPYRRDLLITVAKAYRDLGRKQGGGGSGHVGDIAAATKSFEEAESILEGLADEFPDDAEILRLWGNAYVRHAQAIAPYDVEESIALCRKAEQILDRTPVSRRDDKWIFASTAVKADRADALMQLGRLAEARGLYEETVAERRAARFATHDDARLRAAMASALNNLAACLVELGDYDAAEAPARESLSMRESLRDEVSTGERRLLASRHTLAKVLLHRGALDEAAEHVQLSLTASEGLFSVDDVRSAQDRAAVLELHGQLLEARGDPEAARLAFEEYRNLAASSAVRFPNESFGAMVDAADEHLARLTAAAEDNE